MQANTGRRLNMPTTDTISALWQPDSSTAPIVLCHGLSRTMASSFSKAAATGITSVNGAEQLLLTGGKAHAIKKILVWMVDSCPGYGLVNFPKDSGCPIITAYEDREAAAMLGIDWLGAQLDAYIAEKSMPGGCIPPEEIATKIKNVDTSDSTFEFLVNHVAEKTFEDSQTRFEQESAAKDAKRNSRATKATSNNTTTISSLLGSRRERRPIGDGTAGSYSCRPKLPSDIYVPLKNAFVNPFGNAVNALFQKKLQQARDERHARDRAARQARAEELEEFEQEAEEDQDAPMVTKTLALQPGRKIGKKRAGKLNLADIGVSW